jgi:hypothetical protein
LPRHVTPHVALSPTVLSSLRSGVIGLCSAILVARDAVNAAAGAVFFFLRGISNAIELGASTTLLSLGRGPVLHAKPCVK